MLAAGAPTVETVAGVRVARWEARGRGGKGWVGEWLPAHGPRVAGRGKRRQSVLLRAATAGALVQIKRSHVFWEEVKNKVKYNREAVRFGTMFATGSIRKDTKARRAAVLWQRSPKV